MSRLHTSKICVKSPAKINLHLEIIGKRFDGYHELILDVDDMEIYIYQQMKKIAMKYSFKLQSIQQNEDRMEIHSIEQIAIF